MPTIASSNVTASATVRHIGPAVSCECAIGITPERETKPRVGLMPTMPLIDDGQRIEPSVSVPIATAAKLAATAAPEPDDEPHGLRSKIYGLRVCPPRPDQPLDESFERKFAHSERLVLPIMTAPAARSFWTRKASCFGV